MQTSWYKKKNSMKKQYLSSKSQNSTIKFLSDNEEEEILNNKFKKTLKSIINEIEGDVYNQLNEFKEGINNSLNVKRTQTKQLNEIKKPARYEKRIQ
jgi:hypothetical protein